MFSQSYDCSDIQIKVDIPDDPAELGCPNGDEDCFRMGIPIFFKYIGTGTAPSDFEAYDMRINGTVSGDAGAEIDYSLSNISSCEGELDFDENGTNNAFYYSLEDEANTFEFGSASSPNFTLFVKARPGEDVTVDITSVTFKVDDSSGAACDLDETANPSEIIDIDTPVSKSAPGACSSPDIEYAFDAASDEGTYYEVPLEIIHDHTSDITLDKYDMKIIVEDVYDNLDQIVFNNSEEAFDLVDVSQSGNIYTYYLEYDGVALPYSSGDPLGSFKLYYPSSSDAVGQAKLHFEYGRANNTTNNPDQCCAPDLSHTSGSKLVVDINATNGEAACTGMTLDVDYSTTLPGNGDCKAQYYLTLDGIDAFTVNQIRIEAEFFFSGTISILSADVDSGACPSSDYYCGMQSDCATIDGNKVRYDICAGTEDGIDIDGVNDPLIIEIELDVDAGACVDSVKLTRTLVTEYPQPGIECSVAYTNFRERLCFDEIGGQIKRENDTAIEGVTLYYETVAPGESAVECHTVTDATDGCELNYPSLCTFQLCGQDDPIHVRPSNNTDPGCGVSTLDLVLIQKHVLGIDILDSPYKLISADANNSGSVSTLDMLETQKLILQLIDEYSNNNSWRFVDADYTFPVPANPWSEVFPESVVLDHPVDDATASLIGAKIGDVNLSCPCDSNGFSDDFEVSTVSIKGGDDSYADGDTITVPFQTNGDYDFTAYQLGLTYNTSKLTYLSFTDGAGPGFSPTAHNVVTAAGEIRVLSYDTQGKDKPYTDSTDLFELKFIAEENISSLDTLLTLDSTVLMGAAYDSLGKAYQLTFNYVDVSKFRSLESVNDKKTIGIWPNPADNVIHVGVDDYPGGKFQIQILDMNGRLIYQDNGRRNGPNQKWSIRHLSAWPTGVYLLQLITDEGKRTVKFVKE